MLRRRGEAEGFKLDTFDICRPQDADGIWFIDFPRNRSFFEEILRSKKPATKVVLQVLESPLVVPQSHSLRNQSECDFILTYVGKRKNEPNQFFYRIPNFLELRDEGIPFVDRRCVVMINSNKREGWTGSREIGSRQLPGLGKFLNGWGIPLTRRLFPAQGELYSWRRTFARAAEKFSDRVLDIYGKGWTGECNSWLPAPSPKVFQGAVGDLRVEREKTKFYEQKIPLIGHYRFGIAVENYRGVEGYFSEKLLDVIRAGAVPVYLGDDTIGEVLPVGAFVDARQFSSHAELINFLVNCPEREWEAMRSLGQGFLGSADAKIFGIEAFVETSMRILRKL